jgi:O-antigen/teichoic acid export membrane protein
MNWLQNLWRSPRWVKQQRRAGLVAANSFNNLLPMLFAPVISFLVIRQTSAALWGTFVSVFITVQLGVHIAAWGNHEYLLREFSRSPAAVADAWQTVFRTRLPLILGTAGVCALLYPDMAGWVAVWVVAQALAQSCTVLITYKRDFAFSAGVELGGLVATMTAVLIWRADITPALLIQLFTLVALAKAAVLWFRFRTITWRGDGRFHKQYFALAFTFFLLGFSGMLNSRIDLYAVNLFLSEKEVGTYQVFTSFLIYLQSLAAFMLLPFVKTIYRLQYATIRKISRSLFGIGLLIVPPAMVVLYFLLTALYGLDLPPAFYVVGGLGVLPIFYFLPIIYALYRVNKQTTILQINLLGILLALLLNLLLLPVWGLMGAVISTAVIKWLVLLIYIWQGKRWLQ